MATKFLSKADAATNRAAVLATYRHLLRATGIAFKDDTPTLHASRAYARAEFTRHSTTETGSVASATALEHAQGVTKILREHVVQGRHEGEGKYKLKIHEHTQRLDNDSAGRLRGTRKSFREVKDGVF